LQGKQKKGKSAKCEKKKKGGCTGPQKGGEKSLSDRVLHREEMREDNLRQEVREDGKKLSQKELGVNVWGKGGSIGGSGEGTKSAIY